MGTVVIIFMSVTMGSTELARGTVILQIVHITILQILHNTMLQILQILHITMMFKVSNTVK